MGKWENGPKHTGNFPYRLRGIDGAACLIIGANLMCNYIPNL